MSYRDLIEIGPDGNLQSARSRTWEPTRKPPQSRPPLAHPTTREILKDVPVRRVDEAVRRKFSTNAGWGNFTPLANAITDSVWERYENLEDEVMARRFTLEQILLHLIDSLERPN